MKAGLSISIIIILLFVFDDTQSHWWGRRRRRRRAPPPPPPEPNCRVSDWSAWSQCSHLCSPGEQTRDRRITYRPTTHCQEPNLHEERDCGASNGGCQEHCDRNTGLCSCRTGYALASDGKACQDIDECQPNGGRGPCSHACRNNDGSYFCTCPTGYALGLDQKTCYGLDCGGPNLPLCHVPVYSDHLGDSCKQAMVSCPSGTRYGAQCHFHCPQDFAVAEITNFTLPFAKKVSKSNFKNVIPSTTCGNNPAGGVVWSNAGAFVNNYFCRRVNDPPSDIILSKTTIKEHSPVGTVVGTISVVTPNDGDIITLSLRPSAGEYFFQLQGNTLSNTWIPRWKNLQGLKINEYRIVVRATDQGSPPMWLDKQFNITVINANDPPYSIRISNNSVMDTAALGHVVGTLSAIDYDGPRGSLRSSDFIWMLIDNDGGRFKLRGPQVVVAAALDHQAHRYHRLVVNCTDRDSADPRWAQHSIVINVINTNDSPKNIVFKPYKLYENASTGFLAGEFTAYDEDGDTLVFSISKSDSDTLLTFELGSTSCRNTTINSIKHTVCVTNLVLKRSIDYEVKNSYPVKVTATDPDGGFTVGEFTLHVVNMNEPPTDITLSGDTVSENSPVGTFVGLLTISDPDTSQLSPQGHHCTVHPSKPFGVIGLNLVVSEASLNFETKSSYLITVTCTDTGSPPFSLSKDFVIKVKDRNEKPEYLTLTRSSIQEDARIGSSVGELLTRDPDLNTRSLTFHVKSPVNSPFEIGGTGSKYLITRSRLDYETLQKMELLISVVDDGGLSLEQYFNITIIDVNEPPTDIVISRTTFPENSAPGSVIGTIRVNDPDFNSTASCQIISGDSQHLAVCGLKLCAGDKKVDYEALGSTKTLHVTLRCRDEFQLYVDKSFHIDVTDVNEPPSGIDITVHPVPENAINFMIGQLSVRDPDVNQKYSCKVLYNGTKSLLFTVDALTLGLKTRRPLNFEKQRQHLVTVRCDDGVNASYSQFTAFRDIDLNVLDINELPLNPCPNDIYVDEAASNGYVVWTIKPSDPDNEKYENEKRLGLTSTYQKQLLTTSLKTSSPNFPFQIANEKYLVKMGKLERRVQDVYTFSLNVSDDGMLVRLTNKLYERYRGPILSAIYTCRIRVLASDDQRLFLDVALSSNNISEDALNGTKVGTLSVINPKPGKTYKFALVEPESVPFKIVGHDLILVTGVPLDYETTNSTGVGVLVVDSDGTTSQRMFSIRITNVNERPIKMCLIGNKTVMELTSSDQIVGKIFIEDEDHKDSKGICEKPSPSLGQSQSYSCSIDSNIIDVSSLRRSFYIDKSLVLHGNTTFDYKAKSQYSIPLMCKDVLKPVHIIELVVTVHVKANTVKPVWDFTLSSNTVPEDAPNGTEVGSLSVINAPPGTYKFIVPDLTKPFRVVGTKLVLVYGQPLDYETSNSTNVVIVSTNDAGFYVTKSFLIMITNVNEKPVNLCLLDAISVIPEKSPSNSVIGRLAIEDPDHPESKGACSKPSIVGPLHYYAYTCSIYSASMNIDDIKKKFYIDQSFQLHRKSDFDYRTKDVYNIPILCRDKEKPIHLIEKVFIVRIQAPSCQPGYKFVNGICVCANGLSGPNCDRDPTICTRTICITTEVCVSHVNASKRCIPRVNQVPVLLQLPYSASSPLEKRYKIEGYVESIFEGRRPPGQTLSSLFTTQVTSRRRRDIPKDVYVEGATWTKVLSFYTYTIFVAMDPQSNYAALVGSKMCALLNGTDLRCVNEEDCVLLKKAGIDCPYVFGNSDGNGDGTDGNKGKSRSDSSSGSTMPAVYGGVAACVALIIIIAILLLFNRKRHRKSDQVIYFHDIQDPTSDGMDNPAYGGISPDHSPQIHPHNAEKSKILRNNQTTQASSRRPEDIKTFDNKLYRMGRYDKSNPLYDAMGHLPPPPPPPPRVKESMYESIGKRLGKDTVNSMIEEEKEQSRKKGFDEEVVALPIEQKGKYLEPEYASLENFQKKRRNPNYTEMAGKKPSINKKRFEEGVVALQVDAKGKLNEPVYSTVGNRRGKPGGAHESDLKQKKDKDSNC